MSSAFRNKHDKEKMYFDTPPEPMGPPLGTLRDIFFCPPSRSVIFDPRNQENTMGKL